MTSTLSTAEIAWNACNREHAMQHAEELAAALTLALTREPKVIVEVGCGDGGTLYAWKQICDDVIGITLTDRYRRVLEERWLHAADLYVGDSHLDSTREWLVERLAGRPLDVLFIDGDHSYEGVKRDYEMYAPLVRPGGLVLLHDIAITTDPGCHVDQFWAELSASNPHTSEVVSTKRTRTLGFGVVDVPESTEGRV